MLKRKRRIQKYIKALKHKKERLGDSDILKYKLEDDLPDQHHSELHKVQEPRGSHVQSYVVGKHEVDYDTSGNVWEDEDDHLNLQLEDRNMYRKLNLEKDCSQGEYEAKLRTFYSKRFKNENWAVEGDGQVEMDLQDMLNQEQIYEQGTKSTNDYEVEFFTRTTEKHSSVVTGLDWHQRVMFTSGLDQKLKIWSVNPEETNPELKVKLEKDIYLQKYALTNCIFNKGSVYCGTLRQNYIVLDTNKWAAKYLTSTFLSNLTNYQNIRLNKSTDQCMLFSNRYLSILDGNNCYNGSLMANENIVDASFGKQHQVLAISNDSVYEWDLRMYQIVQVKRKCLGFTKMAVVDDVVGLGNKLGIVQFIKTGKEWTDYAETANLVTYITEMKSNSTNELMLTMSKWKPNAVRVVNIHKGKCVSNWPTVNTKIGFGTVGGFSDRNELAIGSSNGAITIFKLGKPT